ncbi:MAG: SDR family NAD(P)-dependent oxidoreductase [Alphaproteobacteria bacterium]
MTVQSQEPKIRRRFLAGDQDAFARLSGDHNPLHVDPLAARRLIFGGPVVHGVHLLLWALDVFVRPTKVFITNLSVQFVAPILVGAEVALDGEISGPSRHHLRITNKNGEPIVVIDVTWADYNNDPKNWGASLNPDCPEIKVPRIVSSKDVANILGGLDLHLNPNLAGKLFPHLSKAIDPSLLAAVLATSRIVGMEYPGQHSIFSSMSFDAVEKPTSSSTLDYRVVRVRPSLSVTDIEISGGGLEGRIRALFRPPPAIQAKIGELSPQVNNHEFTGQRALIIGGSRGLGEVTAKLLAVGGADVRLTYHVGQEDGERVKNEITDSGGRAKCFAFDVLAPLSHLTKLLENERKTTMLGYFATPHIGAGTNNSYSDDYFRRLMRTYVDGFRSTVKAISADSGNKKLKVLYPSSIYVVDASSNVKEYAAAKEAGERVCAELSTEIGFKFVAPRFPRLATDQTVRLFSKQAPDASTILLDAIRQLMEK